MCILVQNITLYILLKLESLIVSYRPRGLLTSPPSNLLAYDVMSCVHQSNSVLYVAKVKFGT